MRQEAPALPGALRVFERVTGTGPARRRCLAHDAAGVPDGSYGWAQVDRLLGEDLGPRLYVEPVGQGDSDKPRGYRYSTIERADLVEALWRHHGVRRTVVVTFDYTSLVLLELLRRQIERNHVRRHGRPAITAALVVNGGLFADAHTHPWRSTPLLRSPLGALAMRRAQRSPEVLDRGDDAGPHVRDAATVPRRRNAPSCERRSPAGTGRRSCTTRRGSSPSTAATRAAGTSARSPASWAARSRSPSPAASKTPTNTGRSRPPARRVPEAEVLTFPGGHLTTSEHPDLLAAAIRDLAARHGVGTPATDHR